MEHKKIRGVNLGGWLVLESWMTPSLFAGTKAVDETTFCLELGGKAETVLRRHWETFITEDDFRWIADAGLNAVRIPIGHWIFGDVKPYFGAIDILDWAMKSAAKYNLDVLLDLHAAPGCQNGFDNGGIAGVMEWHLYPENVERSLDFIDRLAERYAGYGNLLGIELLNEPRWDVPMEILRDYYIRGYERVRKHLSERYAVVIHDGFRLFEWEGVMRGPEFANVILDTHMYQCFTDEERDMDIFQHVRKAAIQRKDEIDRISGHWPTIVGEWSLGLDNRSLKGLDELGKELAYRAYGASQMLAYERGAGWFFWSYKLEEGITPQWSFRECVARGWLPAKFGDSDRGK